MDTLCASRIIGSMRVLITTLRWDSEIEDSAHKAVNALSSKHPSATIVVGQNTPHIEIARIASSKGLQVHFYYNNIKNMKPLALKVATKATVATGGIGDFYAFMIDSVDQVIALDESDPAVMVARKKGKGIWFPSTGRIIRGFQSDS